MLAICYQEALQEIGCLDLLELQDASRYLSWKVASTNEVNFACYLANKLDIRVEWDPFHPDLIASAPNATLAALACQVKLPLSIQIDGVMTAAICLKTESDLTMTMLAGDRQHLRVEFVLKTDSGYPRDAEVTLFTLANPGSSLRFNTHWSAPPVSALARSGGPRKMPQSPVSRNSNIERRMDRSKSAVGIIRGVV
jgi:hypothetical protein